MTMMKSALACLALLIMACGPAQAPTSAPREPEPRIEEFGPGVTPHEATVDKLMKDATRVLRASYTLAADETPGLVTTEWAAHDASRWPGAQTRVVVEITDTRVVVRVQCRHESASCAGTVPEDVALIELAQSLADEIAWSGGADMVLGRMRSFKDEVCACTDKRCVDGVEKSMMEWAMKNMDRFRKMKPTRAEDEAADQIEDEMEACKERVAPRARRGSTTGSPECDEYLETFDIVADKCADKMGPALDAMKQARDAQAEAFEQWDTLDAGSRKAVIEAAAPGCQSATDALRQAATAMGCPL